MSRPLVSLLVAFLMSAAGSAQVLPTVPPNPSPSGRSQTPPRDAQKPATGKSGIRGRVFAADTGDPIRRANVRINASDLGVPEGRSTVTDGEGRYEFKDLPAGRYTITVSRTPFVTVSYGQTRPGEPGRPLELADNQIADKVDIRLPRGGVITGRVLDEYGEPVANATVMTMQTRFVNGERRPMPSGANAQTPDTGEFRLWGLSPGDYYVAVTAQPFGPMLTENSDDRSGFATTYYPGTTGVTEAQLITIAAGQTAAGVDVMLMTARTAKVSGTVVDSKGELIRRGMVMAMQRSSTMMFSNQQAGRIESDGTFTVSGLVPGEYQLRSSGAGTAPGGLPERAIASITINGIDLNGVVLAPAPPAKITGRIIFDPPVSSVQPAMIRLGVTPKSPEPMGFPLMAGGPPEVKEDFTFELTVAAVGELLIRASATTPEWRMKSVHLEGADITDAGLDVATGHSIEGVEVTMTNRVQTVSGQVTNERGEIVKDCTVFFFPRDRDQWFGATRFTGVGRPDQNGRYNVRSLPAGEYFAVALEYLDQSRRGGDREYFEQLTQGATSLTLSEGETKTLDLRLNSRR